MSLLSSLRKKQSDRFATAIPAIPAIQAGREEATVARIATIAVATPTDAKTADAVTSWGWLLHFADREPLEVYCNPDATHAEILKRYADALAAEPIPERVALDYEIVWPDEVETVSSFDDDRRTCTQCANLIARRCQAAKRGEIVAGRDYEPIRDLLRRCEGYAPGTDDPDTRPGRERWPGLIQKGGE